MFFLGRGYDITISASTGFKKFPIFILFLAPSSPLFKALLAAYTCSLSCCVAPVSRAKCEPNGYLFYPDRKSGECEMELEIVGIN